MDWSQMANASASGAVALTAGVFAAVYHLRARWWTTEAGRHVMAVTIAVGLLSLYTALVTVWWPHGGTTATVLRVARVVLLAALAGLLVQRTRMMIRATARTEQDTASSDGDRED